jgi:phosphonate transport system substrate-binding protein
MTKQLTLAVVPSLADSQSTLSALCTALGEILREPIGAAWPRTYAGLSAALELDRVQFAWMSPALVVLTEERVRLRPLLSSVRNGSTTYCSTLFVDATTDLFALDDLRGRRVAWVDHASASGYLCPRIALAARGIDPDDLFGDQLFLGSHSEVVRAVFDGFVDVGATYAQRPPEGAPVTSAGFLDVAPRRAARVLDWTPPIPNDVIVGHGELRAIDHARFAAAIVELGETDIGRALLGAAFHASRFTPTPPDALHTLRAQIRDARANGLALAM